MRVESRLALALGTACLLFSCEGSSGPSGAGGRDGLTIDVCAGNPGPCDSEGWGLLVTDGNRDGLPVGQSLRVHAALESVCPCEGGIASVEWSTAAPEVVSLSSAPGESIEVTGLTPGQAPLAAEITFASGKTLRAENNWFSSSPFLITVVPAPEG